jgi:hypothetical protein
MRTGLVLKEAWVVVEESHDYPPYDA